MSTTSPSDLAVLFRSLTRRVQEAFGDAAPKGSELDAQLTKAAQLMHTTTDPTAIAVAIDRIAADDWDDATLDSMRAVALEIGHRIREISEIHHRDD
ncbi:MAG: hypothetical protein ABIQ39_05845 [Ilumatobacteraceae bacterium]